MRHKGHGDIKWDQEFTDWEAVARFAADFAAEAGAASPLGGAMSRTRSTLRA